jgi:arsenate reductase
MAIETKRLSAMLTVAAQESRLRLLELIAAQKRDGMTAGSAATALGVPPSTLSFHFAALEQAGLLASTREGRHVRYHVDEVGIRVLVEGLAATCYAGQSDVVRAVQKVLPVIRERSRQMEPSFNVLFLCTRNSARSIMAEAILEKVGGDKFRAYSAGSDPARAPMAEVLDRLQQLGHDVSELRSKSWEEFTGSSAPRMDFVLTLCDPGDGEACPDLGSRPITAVWPFPDPAKFKGSAVERTALLNELYGMIRRRLEAFINLPFGTLDRMAIKKRLDELADPNRNVA